MIFRVNETECKFETECDLCSRVFDYEAMRSDCIETVMQGMGWTSATLSDGRIVQMCPDCRKSLDEMKVEVGK